MWTVCDENRAFSDNLSDTGGKRPPGPPCCPPPPLLSDDSDEEADLKDGADSGEDVGSDEDVDGDAPQTGSADEQPGPSTSSAAEAAPTESETTADTSNVAVTADAGDYIFLNKIHYRTYIPSHLNFSFVSDFCASHAATQTGRTDDARHGQATISSTRSQLSQCPSSYATAFRSSKTR